MLYSGKRKTIIVYFDRNFVLNQKQEFLKYDFQTYVNPRQPQNITKSQI